MSKTRVGLVGASGETGNSILNGLVEAGGFEIVALTRPSSMSKRINESIAKLPGVELRALDLTLNPESMAPTLEDIDILLSAIGPMDQLSQIPLATAAKQAGVRLFSPCGYITVMPPGIHRLRDQKELVYNHIKRIGLPYTIIDVGWWYQISFPPLPSGKIDYVVGIPNARIPGDGNCPSAITDLRDIGRYVARIIKDERTVNKYVLVYNEMWTPKRIYDLLEKLSGEKLPREYDSLETLRQRIAEAEAKIAADSSNANSAADNAVPADFGLLLAIIGSEYLISWGIRGDNTPEYAKYLGYVTSKELYPEMEFVKFEDYLKEVLEGNAKGVYEAMKEQFKKAMEGMK